MANSRKSKSDLPGRVADALIPLVPRNSSLLLGLSGGLDSVVLLHVLSRLAQQFSWRLSALHVHHGISPHADSWATFCGELCAQHSIPLQIERVDITPLRDMGIEAAARQLRHAALSRQAADFIVLAHHRDDQAETLLLQLLRGAGVRGASAMPVLVQRSGAPSLLRPLLDIERAELAEYASQHGLRWVEDDSNADVSYPRNFLRHRILPELEQRFPGYRTTLSRSARHFAEAADLLDELAVQDAAGAMKQGLLGIEDLCRLSAARGRNLLRHYLQQCGAPLPDTARLTEMQRQLCEASADAQVCVEWGGWQVRAFRGRVYVMQALQQACEFSISWQGEAEIVLPGSHGVLCFEPVMDEGVCLAKMQGGPVQIRSRHGQASLHPASNRPRRSLRNLLQEHAVPPWQRELLPLVYCGGDLVCVPGVAIDAAYQAQPGEEGVRIIWQTG